MLFDDIVELHNEPLPINGVAAEYSALPENIEDTLLTTTRAMVPVFMREQLLGQSRRIMLVPQVAARRDFSAMPVPSGHHVVIGTTATTAKIRATSY